MIIWIWSNSFIWSIAPLLGWSSISYEPSHLSCTVNLMNPDWKYKSYIITVFIWCYLLPLLIMAYFLLKPSNNNNNTSNVTVRSQEIKNEMNVRF